jgi:hypothetical protein
MTVGQPHPSTLKELFGGPSAKSREEVVQRAVRSFSIIGSPAYETNASDIAIRPGWAWDRDHDEVATLPIR